MARYVAGLVSVLLVIIGGVLFWQGRPDQAQAVPMPPPPQAAETQGALFVLGWLQRGRC